MAKELKKYIFFSFFDLLMNGTTALVDPIILFIIVFRINDFSIYSLASNKQRSTYLWRRSGYMETNAINVIVTWKNAENFSTKALKVKIVLFSN